MRYQGRVVDPIALWSNFVEFPSSMRVDDQTVFLPLVVCPNPDHETNKRHFQINIQQGLVHCFANCGISGTFEHAISMVEGITHRQARKTILKHSRIGTAPIPRKRGAKRTNDAIPAIDLSSYTVLPEAALLYLKQRKISDRSVSDWQIKWDSDELRVVIPVFDTRGRVTFVIKRGIFERQQPKYLYEPEGVWRNGSLFGLDRIDPGMLSSTGIVVVEGSLDVIRLHQHGITNTVGILGSKLSLEQAQLISNLRPKRITTMFDADATGISATQSVRKRLGNHPIVVCRYPKGKTDPAMLDEKEAARVISRAIPYVQFNRLVTRLITSKERESVGNSNA